MAYVCAAKRFQLASESTPNATGTEANVPGWACAGEPDATANAVYPGSGVAGWAAHVDCRYQELSKGASAWAGVFVPHLWKQLARAV